MRSAGVCSLLGGGLNLRKLLAFQVLNLEYEVMGYHHLADVANETTKRLADPPHRASHLRSQKPNANHLIAVGVLFWFPEILQ